MQEAYRQQLRGFMSFVDQQRQLPVLKQFLKLYTTISLPKLAGLMDTDENAVKEQLKVLEVSLCLWLIACDLVGHEFRTLSFSWNEFVQLLVKQLLVNGTCSVRRCWTGEILHVRPRTARNFLLPMQSANCSRHYNNIYTGDSQQVA